MNLPGPTTSRYEYEYARECVAWVDELVDKSTCRSVKKKLLFIVFCRSIASAAKPVKQKEENKAIGCKGCLPWDHLYFDLHCKQTRGFIVSLFGS